MKSAVILAGIVLAACVAGAETMEPVVPRWTPKCVFGQPRYAWRGHMLDVSRHFFTVDDVKKTLDLMHRQAYLTGP